MNDIKLDKIEEAIEAIKNGQFVIVVDDEDRENEGDFICAAEKITPEMVNFMITHGRGVVCTPVTEDACKRLELEMQVPENTSIHGTPFTITIDLLEGCTTGVSVQDRAATIRAIADPNSKPQDFGRPGHINPLRARDGGVLRRAGHTEAAVDLARMAGLQPCGALIEIMNEDGSMARLPQLMEVAEKYQLKIVSIKDLIEYRLRTETLIMKEVEVDFPTQWGHFKLFGFTDKTTNYLHLAIVKGTWEQNEPILVRVHSSCATGDIFGSCRCDCGEQLHQALKLIEEEGKGIVLYLYQEGRGIGLLNKLKAYYLQDQGIDTVDANLMLGFKADERDYGVGAQILRYLHASNIRLLTNNPVKQIGLEAYDIKIVRTEPLIVKPNTFNEKYLETKAKRMGHKL